MIKTLPALDVAKNGAGWYQQEGKNILEYGTGIPDFGADRNGNFKRIRLAENV